jgi:hypothetical protein
LAKKKQKKLLGKTKQQGASLVSETHCTRTLTTRSLARSLARTHARTHCLILKWIPTLASAAAFSAAAFSAAALSAAAFSAAALSFSAAALASASDFAFVSASAFATAAA